MTPVYTKDTNLDLGAPENWNRELQGDCISLPCIWKNERFLSYTSFWKPTAEELAVLNAGGAVTLEVCGLSHPPVMIGAATYEPGERN